MIYYKFVGLCEKKGVSPSRAAVEAGISKSLVTKWKTNKVQDPSADIARKIAAYFNISVAELLEGEDCYLLPTELRGNLSSASEAEWSRFVLRALLNYHERMTLNENYPGLDCWKSGLQFAISCVEEKIKK